MAVVMETVLVQVEQETPRLLHHLKETTVATVLVVVSHQAVVEAVVQAPQDQLEPLALAVAVMAGTAQHPLFLVLR